MSYKMILPNHRCHPVILCLSPSMLMSDDPSWTYWWRALSILELWLTTLLHPRPTGDELDPSQIYGWRTRSILELCLPNLIHIDTLDLGAMVDLWVTNLIYLRAVTKLIYLGAMSSQVDPSWHTGEQTQDDASCMFSGQQDDFGFYRTPSCSWKTTGFPPLGSLRLPKPHCFAGRLRLPDSPTWIIPE